MDRLKKLGVVFRSPPTKMGTVTIAIFEDMCGDLIQIAHDSSRRAMPPWFSLRRSSKGG